MESDISLDVSLTDNVPAPAVVRAGPPPLPPRTADPAVASGPAAPASLPSTGPASSPEAASSKGPISEPSLSDPPSPPTRTSGPPVPPADAPPSAAGQGPSSASVRGAGDAVSGAAVPPPPPLPEPPAATSQRWRPAIFSRPFWADVYEAARDWVVTAGLWWALSATTHAVVISLVVLMLGTVIVTPKYQSAAPTFEAAVNTVVGETDLESFDITSAPLDGADLGRDLAASAASAASAGGEMVGALSGGPGGSWSAGEGSGSASTAGFVGLGGGGGGGAGGGLGLLGPDSAWKKSGGKLPGGGGSVARRRAANGGVVAAGDANQAVDNVLKGIQGELDKGDVLVCWLIDASLSLADDRQVIATRVEPFFRKIEAQDPKKSHRLLNSVVGFSDTTWEVIKPTNFSSQIVEAIRNLPLATSGVENVMSAVDQCVEQYGRKWKGGFVIVVWTDESGDDILYLEQVIQKCKRRGVLVSVVGPTAVLGSEQGRHHWVDKGTGYAFLLPIKRGPDTSIPERLLLPYWHDSPLAPWIQNGVIAASGTPWYGGPHREGLLSGVGPYALTRLALETGGTFTLLDRKEDRGPFQWDVMKRYLPDYASASEYLDTVSAKPLRKAVSAAVMATYQDLNLIPPAMAFVLHRYPNYPYPVVRPYYTPDQFRALLREEVPRQQVLVQATNRLIEQALAQFPTDGMEAEYSAERSLRWRAWYDLTRGRLLAMSVRQLEYVLACEKLFEYGTLKPETNHVVLKPSPRYLAGSRIEPRAREAFRLLTRCAEQNAGTPWAMLAKWELAHELGIEIEQVVVPVPQPSGPAPPPDPPIKFPNL